MIRYVDSKKMGRGIHDWLDSHFHFSFADYYNPKNIHFGVLRVINDDLIQPGEGFGAHPHADMEIISYVVDGEITHRDSMGNEKSLSRGEVQYMSAGTGVVHSEYNHGKDVLRLLQLWIFPDQENHQPNYGDYKFKLEDRIDQWLHMVTSVESDKNVPIKIHQDVNIYSTILSKGKEIGFEVGNNRQAYLVLIEGDAVINAVHLHQRDALEIVKEDIVIKANKESHFLVVEMAFDQEWYDEQYR